MNKIILIGRLTKDPELTYLQNSNATAVCKFTLAVNRPRLDKNKPQEADFINCVCFGKRAEAIQQYVSKGNQFGVTGRLQINKYVDKDNQNRWSTDVNVEDFEFLQGKSDNNQQGSTQNRNNSFEDNITPVDDGDMPF